MLVALWTAGWVDAIYKFGGLKNIMPGTPKTMKKFIMIAVLLGISGAVSGSAKLAADHDAAAQNCATNTAPTKAPKRHSVVPRTV